MDTVHTMTVNAHAIAASATPACAALADKAPSIRAPLELPLDAFGLPADWVAEGDPELEAVVPEDGNWELDGTAEVEGEVPLKPVVPGRYDGAGTALEGSARAPVPQGIPSPSGWVRFGAATVVPFGNAMAKRPVQRRSEALPG